jgi:hypothetical protein
MVTFSVQCFTDVLQNIWENFLMHLESWFTGSWFIVAMPASYFIFPVIHNQEQGDCGPVPSLPSRSWSRELLLVSNDEIEAQRK